MPKQFTICRTAEIAAPVEAVYQVVADVERYPEFLPGVQSVRVRGHLIEMTVNIGPLVLTWLQRATFDVPRAITFVQVEGPFRFFRGGWTFEGIDEKTRIAYTTEFELSMLLPGMDRIVERALTENIESTIAAFHQRLRGSANSEDGPSTDRAPA